MRRVMDTIFALASGMGRAGVAVMRISGLAAYDALTAFGVSLGAARQARLVHLRQPVSGEVIDQALVLRFDAGASFTGEPVVELQLHGSGAVVREVERVLGGLAGFRRAEPGEFTQRAFLNGRMDLTQVEALADLIDSDTEQQRQQAMRQLEGVGGRGVREWRRMLTELRAMVAGVVDFSDEGDVDDQLPTKFDSDLEQLVEGLMSSIAARRAGRILRDGFRIALLGAPNSGKSTLLNWLAGAEIAIVSDMPGTTRDVLEVRLDIEGWPVILQDMAGIRTCTDDRIEQIGIERAWDRAVSADLVLVLHPADGTDGDKVVIPEGLSGDVVHIRTKADLVANGSELPPEIAISARFGTGLDSLRALIASRLADVSASAGGAVLRSERQFALIELALERCVEVRKARRLGIEFVDDALVRVDHILGRIVGHIGVDDVLDDVFSRFCIGK
jgi:tRNA modification GTPase